MKLKIYIVFFFVVLSSFSFAQCNKIVSQELNGFNPNPVDKWDWSYDTLSLINLSNCDIQIRPEFTISHDSIPIGNNDFDLKWYNPYSATWNDIIYSIDLNGNATGYWTSLPGDTTGYNMTQGAIQPVIIRVRFKSNANYGTYSAIWKTNEVDSIGGFIQMMDADSTSLSLVDCSNFQADSSYTINVTNISCFGANNGEAKITMLAGSNPTGTVSLLSYCASNPNSNFNGQAQTIIEEVQLTGDNFNITNNTAGAADSYEDYTSTIYADLSEGNTYTVNVILDDLDPNGAYSPEAINIYIDFNIDGDFDDAGEDLGVVSTNNWTAGTIYPFNFTVPSSGIYGPTRMRVVCMSNAGSGVTMGPCESPTGWDPPWFGATEDYSIVLNAPTLAATYQWQNGSTLDSIYSLGPGTYYVTITNIESGCEVQDSVIITEPNEITFSLNANNTTTINSCDGSISVTNILEGCAPYTYLWNDSQSQTTDTAINLCIGSYCVDISDCNGCTVSSCITVSQQCTFNTIINTNNVSCFGNNNGNATVIPTGGIAPYTYNWSDGQDTATATNLYAGNYNVIVTDSIGCAAIIDSIIINEPNELTSSYTQTNISCFGLDDGSAIVNFFGGTIGSMPGDTNYILGWAGTTTQLYLPFPIDSFNTNLLPAPFNAIPAGVYPYTVTDLNGCIIYDTITITEPDSLYAIDSTSNYNGFEISCYGDSDGEIDIEINGGTGPFYNYLNGVFQPNWLSTNLSAGSYNNEIIDANGCTITNTIILNEPSPIISTLSTANISCNGLCDGQISSSISGGVNPYFFSWNNNTNSNNIDSICAGTYTLTITDNNNCIESLSSTIIEPNPISINIDSLFNITNYDGNDGAIYISPNGGSGQLSINWSNDNGLLSNNEDISNLIAGFYYLEIIDTNNCSYTDTIELNQPSSLWMNLDFSVNTSCFDSCNGKINISVNGGDSSYIFTWTGPNNFTSNNEDLTNLCYGEYIIILDDGITILTDTFNIYQPQPIISTLIVDSILCHNDSTQAEINIWGGTQPFSYNWSNGSNNYFTNYGSGNHSIQVIDINGCMITDSFSLINPDSIISINNVSNTSCFGGNDGNVVINVLSGGNPDYSYSNDNGVTYQSSNIFNNLTAGNYTFLVSDINGCLSSTSAIIMEPDAINSNTNSVDASCYGYCDGIVSVNASGGTPPYSYSWSNGNNNLCAGFYNVTITDFNNCIAINSAIVNEPNPILINIWIDENNLVATSGFSSYQWYLSDGTLIPGATSNIFEPSSIGEYYVMVTNNDCEETSYTIDYNISGLEILENKIKIYPNPTNGIINIKTINDINNITILNYLGNQLLRVENKNNNQDIKRIDLSNFVKGIYFIQIEHNNQLSIFKITLQ